MTPYRGFSRRRVLAMTTAGLAAAQWPLAPALAQAGPRAVGQPFPRGVSLPSQPPAAPVEGGVGVALVGLGRYALAVMAPALVDAERCHLAAVVSGNPDKAARVAAAYGLPDDAIYSYDTYDQMADDDRIDVVYIILPSGLHAEWTERAFAAGKHVMCEKPMALTGAECERMIAAGAAAGRQLMIGYRCHFEPYNLRAMELMRENIVGEPQLIRTDHHYVMGPTTPAENWRANRALAGGGALEDYGLYGLQAALYLAHEAPESVSAAVRTPANDPRFAEIVGHVAAQLRFPSGAVAQIATSYTAASQNRIEVRGRDGVLLMDPATGYGGMTMNLRGRGRNESYSPGDPRVQFAGQLDHFAAVLRDGVAIKTPGEMGLRDVRLMEAIYASAETGRTLALRPDGRVRES